MTNKAELKIKVKCTGCNYTKTVGPEQTTQPFCDKCHCVMIAEEASAKLKD